MNIFNKRNFVSIDEEDLNDANLSCADFKNDLTRKRSFIDVLGARLAMKYLFSNKINANNLYSLYTIHNVLEEIDVADIYFKDVKIDVRLVFNENEIFVPKSHFEFGILPDVYFVLGLKDDLSSAEFLGYFEPNNLDKTNENKDFYFYEGAKLKNPKDFRRFLDKFQSENDFVSTEADVEKAKDLFLSLVDKEAENDEKIFMLQQLSNNFSLREKLVEFENFEIMSKFVAKDETLFKDNVLDIVGAQSITELPEEEMLTIDLTELVDEEVFEEEKGESEKEKEDFEEDDFEEISVEDLVTETEFDSELQIIEEEECAEETSSDLGLASGIVGGALAGGIIAGGIVAGEAIASTISASVPSIGLPDINIEDGLNFNSPEFDKSMIELPEQFAQELKNEFAKNAEDIYAPDEEFDFIEQEDETLIEEVIEDEIDAETKIDIDSEAILETAKTNPSAIQPFASLIDEGASDIDIDEQFEITHLSQSVDALEESADELSGEEIFNDEETEFASDSDSDFQIVEEESYDEPTSEIDELEEYAEAGVLEEDEEPKGSELVSEVAVGAVSGAVAGGIIAGGIVAGEAIASTISASVPSIGLPDINIEDGLNFNSPEFDKSMIELPEQFAQELKNEFAKNAEDLYTPDEEFDFIEQEDETLTEEVIEDAIDVEEVEEEINLSIIHPFTPSPDDELPELGDIESLKIEPLAELDKPELITELGNLDIQDEKADYEEVLDINSFDFDMFDDEEEVEKLEDIKMVEENLLSLESFDDKYTQEVISVQEVSGDDEVEKLEEIEFSDENEEASDSGGYNDIRDLTLQVDELLKNMDLSDEQKRALSIEVSDAQNILKVDDDSKLSSENNDLDENDKDVLQSLFKNGSFGGNLDESLGDFSSDELGEQFGGEYGDENETGIDFKKRLSAGPKNKKTMIAASVAGVILVSLVAGGIQLSHKSQDATFPNNMQNTTAPVSETTSSADELAIPDMAQTGEQASDIQNMPMQDQQSATPGRDMGKAVSDAFTSEPLTANVTKVAWEVPEDLAYNDSFRKYLQIAGKNLKLTLQSNLLLSTEMAYSNKVVLDLEINNDGSLKSSNITVSSGSKQIDQVVLQSVKETLKYLKMPSSELSGQSVSATLIINF